uniref:lanthionine synthetase LanC family protein n=1 Tax=Chitinophaga parva TaxID=2169414 RepID=UPI001402761E|nr:lanthionine synthetase LanC family protein [Chitinophaga parva]
MIISGRYGNANIGRIINVYPSSDTVAASLAMELAALTLQTNGPSVTNGFHLGGGLYAVHQDGANGILPGTIPWPFTNIPRPPSQLSNRIGTYLIAEILKNDPKGRVIKAIRRKTVLDTKIVIVKEGKRFMCTDAEGRDMRTRLQWQQRIGTMLKNKVIMPEIYEYFEKDGDAFLAMEFIDGSTFRKFVLQPFEKGSWIDFPPPVHLAAIDKLLEIVGIAETIHGEGLVHRDLSTMNFLIRKGKLCLLDMELAYYMKEDYPNPPFGVGSEGYMSPEQRRGDIPTFKEDIYAIGAIMQKMFTGVDPYRLFSAEYAEMREKMIFFVHDEALATLVAGCLNIDPGARPSLNIVKETLESARARLAQGLIVNPALDDINEGRLRSIILQGIDSLARQFGATGQWFSRDQEQTNLAPTEEGEYKVYLNFHQGAAGIMYMLCRAASAGFDISGCRPIIDANWQDIADYYLNQPEAISPGLGQGLAGVALTIATAHNTQLLPTGWPVQDTLAKCFTMVNASPGIYDGQAGQGVAAIAVAGVLPGVTALLPHLVNTILPMQTPKGEWLFQMPGEEQTISHAGFMAGTAGITYFLLCCYGVTKEDAVKTAAVKALKYLQSTVQVKDGKRIIDKQEAPVDIFYGLGGIALTFIKAYEILQDPIYKQFAEAILNALPARYLMNNLTTSVGITGIGEVYLEAHRVFQDDAWRKRAAFIAKALTYMALDNGAGGKFWLTDNPRVTTADLMVGNAGIIHFLLRYLHPGKFGFPMLTA